MDIALANRPFNNIKNECPCKLATKNDLSSVKPYYSESDVQKTSFSTGNLSGDGGREIPVIIKKNRGQYMVLEKTEEDKNEDVYIDSWGDLPVISSQKPEKVRVDVITQFYIASLSVIALYVVFRMIQKTK